MIKKWYNRLVLVPAVFFTPHVSRAQQADYFQQEVNYTIHVQLNDQQHSLSAQEELVYTNNSKQKLDTIYMHLWPNAYKDNSTALAKQLLLLNETNLHFSKEEERGFIDSLNFAVNGVKVKWQYHPKHQDICYLILNEALAPATSCTISTPFYVKLPDAKFSRLGHTEQAYYITQWYPKPAVFDSKGWHAMPYLNQGEFYSEFGSFDVFITLPQNYVLAATGDRIDAEDENTFLEKKFSETQQHVKNDTRFSFGMDFPPSSNETKTVHFRQYRVHDFAWFADKRFYVLKDQIELPESKRLVDTWVLFTGKNFGYWKDALRYVNESTIFYSYHLGDYPYNHVTAVDGTIMAGGGMEYPNITVINDPSSAFELDMVITHEVGHNWFYGILGSNEREHPFLDEGLNSLYELRYVRAKYGDKKLGGLINMESLKLFRINKLPIWKYHELTHFIGQRSNADQAINLHSEEYTPSNYGAVVYSKTASDFDYLLHAVEEQRFDAAMKLYFSKFRFKHPYPEDLFATLTESLGEDISWFVKNFYTARNHVDYKLKRVKHLRDGGWALKIKNKGEAEAPFTVQGVRNGRVVVDVYSKGLGKKILLGAPEVQVDYFTIDRDNTMPELRRNNNTVRTHGIFKKVEPIQFNFLTAIDLSNKTQINWLPTIGANNYNGLLVGLCLHNYAVTSKPFEIALNPMFGFSDRTLNGTAEMFYNIRPLKGPKRLSVGIRGKKYSNDFIRTAPDENRRLYYAKLSPELSIEFQRSAKHPKRNTIISYVSNILLVDSAYPTGGVYVDVRRSRNSFINELSYELNDARAINPFSWQVQLQHTSSMAKIASTFKYSFTISSKRSFDIRVFAGTFLAGSIDERSYFAIRAAGAQGYQDYLFEGNFYSRSNWAPSTFVNRQFIDRDGALKVWTPWGQSATWLVALNLRSPRIIKALPIKLFADVVACDAAALGNNKVLWDAGLEINVVKDIVTMYLPLLYSSDIKDALSLNGLKMTDAFRFTFNIHKLEPRKIAQTQLF